MKSLAIKTGVNAIALWVAAIVLSGITLTHSGASGSSKVLTVIVVALLFGLINAFVKPIAKVLSFPFIILTLGLFTFVVNALMLQLLSWLSDKLDLAFHVQHFFWDAILGSLIISFIAMILNMLLPDSEEVRR